MTDLDSDSAWSEQWPAFNLRPLARGTYSLFEIATENIAFAGRGVGVAVMMATLCASIGWWWWRCAKMSVDGSLQTPIKLLDPITAVEPRVADDDTEPWTSDLHDALSKASTELSHAYELADQCARLTAEQLIAESKPCLKQQS